MADSSGGKVHAVEAAGTSVVVACVGDSLCAARTRCPHMGFSLDRDQVAWAPGFAGRDIPRWSRKMVAFGRKPSALATYDLILDGDDV